MAFLFLAWHIRECGGLELAINACERSHPAFQFVVWGGQEPADAVAAAMLEPVGEA